MVVEGGWTLIKGGGGGGKTISFTPGHAESALLKLIQPRIER
jgi:hypothetical protein